MILFDVGGTLFADGKCNPTKGFEKLRHYALNPEATSGKSLSLAIKRWIPSAKFEFCLTSADILFTKPSRNIFITALKHAGLEPE